MDFGWANPAWKQPQRGKIGLCIAVHVSQIFNDYNTDVNKIIHAPVSHIQMPQLISEHNMGNIHHQGNDDCYASHTSLIIS
jgi:hypothetical protein